MNPGHGEDSHPCLKDCFEGMLNLTRSYAVYMAWILHLVGGILYLLEATAADCATSSISHDVPCLACTLHSAMCICHHFAHELHFRTGIGNLGAQSTCQIGSDRQGMLWRFQYPAGSQRLANGCSCTSVVQRESATGPLPANRIESSLCILVRLKRVRREVRLRAAEMTHLFDTETR